MAHEHAIARPDLAKRTSEVVKELIDVIMPSELLAEHPHLVDTPRRMTDWLLQYSQNGRHIEDVITVFDEQTSTMVVEHGIDFSAICAHHLLPFFGKAAVGYIPAGKVLGLSKLSRVVEFYAERITLQEHITEGIVEGLMQTIKPNFVAAYLYDVTHCCMTIRGVEQRHAKTDTFDSRGRDIYVQTFFQMVGRK